MKFAFAAAVTIIACLITMLIGCPSQLPTAPTGTGPTGESSGSLPTADTPPPPGPAPTGFVPSGQTASVIATGDIGMCSERDTVQRTADLVARLAGEVLLLGDLAYMHGTLQNFRDCFDPAWGRFRQRWRPVPGNHEYETAGAAGYHAYFGAAASPAGRSYYAFRTADWLVLMLDSNEPSRVGSAQYEFARSALATARPPCTLVAWHHPLFSSGPNGPNIFMRDLWGLLDAEGADVLLVAHDHLYERFGPQNVDAQADAAGIRQFVVGTGGARLYEAARRERNSQALVRAHGVLHLTLQPTSYRWEFIDIAGAVRDAGADLCH